VYKWYKFIYVVTSQFRMLMPFIPSHTCDTDATQLDSWVVSASQVWTGH